MFKSLTTSQKIRSAFAIATVFVLVISTNQLDKQYYDSIKKTMKTIYEDRLVAKGYLYELNTIFFRKHIDVIEDSSYTLDLKQNEKIDALVLEFDATKFTNQEESQFNKFKMKLERLYALENKLSSSDSLSQMDIDDYCNKLKKVEQNLYELAQIQLGEGKSQIKSAQLFTEKNDFLAQIELGLLIAMGLIVQFLIFYRFKS